MKPSVDRAVAQSFWSLILGLMLAMSAPISADDVLRVMLEEPVAGEIHGGVGNLRGWAVATDGIDKIEIMIDGEYAFDAPYIRGALKAVLPSLDKHLDTQLIQGVCITLGNERYICSGIHRLRDA